MSEKLADRKIVEKFLGPFRKEQLKNTDSYVGDKVAMFMPVVGFCDYAVTSEHSHPSYLFVLTFNDKVFFNIDSENFTVEPGMLLALSPDVIHKEIITDCFTRYIAIFVDKEFFEEQLNQYSMDRFFNFAAEYIQVPPNFLTVIKEFMLEVDNKIPGWESVIYANGMKLCHSLIRSMLNLNHKQDEIVHRLEINNTIEYMHSNLDKKIKIADLAEIAHMSPSYFTRTFKRETGQSSISYLNNIRLERVKRLLIEGDKSITEIALDCGFNSPAYLTSAFHKKYNISPTDYRNLFKK